MIEQQEVNDCIICCLSNYLHDVLGGYADRYYSEIHKLLADGDMLTNKEYLEYLEGHGIPLDVIIKIGSVYHISFIEKRLDSLPDEPCIILIPIEADTGMKFDCHAVYWDGNDIHDPIQFNKLKTTKEHLLKVIKESKVYI